MSNSNNKSLNKILAANSHGAGNRGARGGRVSNFGYYLSGQYHNADQKRNVWEVAGYPDIVDFSNHWEMANRFGIANAGINRIVQKCWQSPPIISDGEVKKDRALTPFEQDLKYLVTKKHLWSRMKGLDRRQRVGRYAGLIPIAKEQGANKSDKPMSRLMGVKSIMKLVPVFESQIDVTDVGTNSDLNDPNYGMPEYYNFRQNVEGDRNPITNEEQQLHPSRVFVYAEGADDGSIYGVPANEAGYNDLLDMEKVRASGAEGLFKNAKQRTVVNVNDKNVASAMTTDPKKKATFDESADDFSTGFDSMLMTYGMDVQTLNSTLADPTNPWTIALNSYAASISIPATILVGQQTGRLASDEDQSAWSEVAKSRCENDLSPMIIAFFDYMIEIGAMRPYGDDLSIEWPDFSEPSTSDKLASAKTMEETNKIRYESGRGEPIYSDEKILAAAGFDMDDMDKAEEFEEQDTPNEVPVDESI